MRRVFQKKGSKLLIISLTLALLLSLLAVFYYNDTYHEVLLVRSGDCNTPYINVTIEKSRIPLEIDLGSRLEMDIQSNVLEKLQRRPYGVEKWKNFRGTDFKYPTYILPKIKLGSLAFDNPIAVEFSPERSEENVIWKETEQEQSHRETVGHLGRGLLKKVNFLLDMANSKMIISNSPRKLKFDGYHLEAFKKIPFTLGPKGIVIEVDTDLGRMKFLLDTGCTWTMVHDFLYPKDLKEKTDRYGFPVLKSTRFNMNGIDFGSQDFYFINMTEELREIDGLLGMDFIEKHVLYIDFSESILYVIPNEKNKGSV